MVSKNTTLIKSFKNWIITYLLVFLIRIIGFTTSVRQVNKKFFIEAEKNRVLKKPFRFTKPVILIHGLKDNVVKEDVPRKILKKTTGKNVNLIYLKESDHRLSTEIDLKMITQSIDYIRQNL